MNIPTVVACPDPANGFNVGYDVGALHTQGTIPRRPAHKAGYMMSNRLNVTVSPTFKVPLQPVIPGPDVAMVEMVGAALPL